MTAFDLQPVDTALQHLDIEDVFQQVFELRYRTRLVGGGDEPVYRPASDGSACNVSGKVACNVNGKVDRHTIVYTRDYAASALHEVAHWCVAGSERRQLEDYGYWYAPDGRTVEQQALFEQMEVKPQAFEWIFSVAAGREFRVSADNLEAELGASERFKQAIYQQVQTYCQCGLPERAGQFAAALAAKTGLCEPLNAAYYCREAL